jgi:hypothetical protein
MSSNIPRAHNAFMNEEIKEEMHHPVTALPTAIKTIR